MIGQTIAHYKVTAKLGAGGMGEVYRAHDEQLDRDVALKVLPASSFSDAAARARLLREARSAAALNHPHICTIYEVGEADGQAYIAMELVEGESLSARLAAGPLPAKQVLRYGSQIADALSHAHERGIVHRDLKSANVALTPDGRAKVLDFGLAKRVSGEELAEVTRSQLSLTAPGAVAGTLAYMAPEQLRGEPADARSDIWALGVVLHEMLSGQRPFQGKSGYELSAAILREQPGPLPAKAPLPLRAVVGRCLAKEPGERYQRAAEVRAALEAIATGAVAPWAGLRYALRRRQVLAASTAVVVLLAAAIAANLGGLRERLFGARAAKIESIAVLPLENLSGDPEQEYFAAGIHESLITDLAKLSGLRRVIARSSVLHYKGTDKRIPEIAEELNVDAVITGSVARAGVRVRITAQLIHARTEETLWAERYERDLRDVLALQSEVTRAITQKIQVELTPQEQARLASPRPVNPEVYELYLRGQFYVNKLTPEEFQRGLAYLQQAVEKDPAEPLAYAGLALAYAEGGHMLVAPPQEAFPQARAAALKALELDDTLAEAYTALAMYAQYYNWDWPAAEQAFRRALELNPNFAQAHQHHGWYLRALGHPEEAIAELKRAKELDPLKPLFGANLAYLYSDAGQYDQAIDEAQKVLELDPNFPLGLGALGTAYAGKGMYNEAIATHQRLTADPAWKLELALTYARAGQPDKTRQMLAGLKDEEKDPWMLATVYVALGDKNEAMRWLETAYKARHQFLPYTVYGREFASLQSDPRFQNLVRRMNFPQ
jgi:serine/threonine-protein kinase